MANEAGAGCTSGGNDFSAYTIISNVAASVGGSCDRLACYAAVTGTLKALNFAFFTRSVNDFTLVADTRQTLTCGAGTQCWDKSAPGDFTAFSVSAGNYLGCYCQRNQHFDASGGSGMWHLSGDNTSASSTTFTQDADAIDALTADITAGGEQSVVPLVMHHLTKNIGV